MDETLRRATPMVRDIVRHGSVAPSTALAHPSYCLQCIAPFPIPPLDGPLTGCHTAKPMLAWPRAAYTSRPTSSKGIFRTYVKGGGDPEAVKQ
ncbi:hypothetical protein T265_00959 [Opisthorchis viverrini]|uniref:Uncharacterized protein n=1 Tax=Opisthorchis viverrini TaxID=6198 RepID=A0A075A111_OPIVI|nr:hypothetical protein T265_00959 [Opisthorchis viverrini]KER33056.1 hypothetical protein T265_00959 [Opisthorchis viverrini]